MNKKSRFEIANKSDVGRVRQANEDYFGYFSGSWGELIIVSDGMGGNKGGYTASRVAVNTIKKHFESLPETFEVKEELRNALIAADDEMKRQSETHEDLREMGATVVVLLLRNDEAFIAHIGDSRIYLIREERIHQLTRDHSLVQQLVDAKIITPEAAKTHPKRNVISRSLGADGNSEPEIEEPFALFKDDRFVLCTDGLTGYVDGEELKQEVLGHSIYEACDRLVTLANDRGGKDNITVQIVHIIKGKKQPIKLKLSPQTQKYAIAGSALAFVVLAFTFVSLFAPNLIFKSRNGMQADSLRLKQMTPTLSVATISDSLENVAGYVIQDIVQKANNYHEGDIAASQKVKIKKQDVYTVFDQLKQGADRKLLYSLSIVKHPGLNCYTVPGGKIYLTTGLIEQLNDKNQIAFLLAHQIGHGELRHCFNSLLPGANFVSGSALIDSLKKISAEKFVVPFNQSQEIAADSFAVSLLKKTHLSTDGAKKFMAGLQEYEKKATPQPRRDLIDVNLFRKERLANLDVLLKK